MKFNIGDKVEIVKGGSGVRAEEVGKIVTIVERKEHGYTLCREHGYKIEPKLGNCATGHCGGWIGESTFELVSSKLTDKQIGILEGVIKCDGEFCTVDVLCEKECLVFKECGVGGVGDRERRVEKAQQLLAENKVKIKTKESNMNQNIIKLFPKDTAAADLVERYFGTAFTGESGNVLTVLAKGKEADILAEAKRLEAESKKDK